MTLNIAKEVAAMQRMTIDQLRDKYADVFGESPRSRHKDWLVKRIAWRLQANAEGDLTERARRRAAELANDADLRVTAPKVAAERPVTARHDGLILGTRLFKKYKGRTIVAEVKPEGIAYNGQIYPSLSAVAKAVTGAHWSGNRFFGLPQTGGVA